MFSKLEKKILLLSFLAGNGIIGGITGACIYLDELKRPGQTDSLALEVIFGGLKLGVPAGLIITLICALIFFAKNRLK